MVVSIAIIKFSQVASVQLVMLKKVTPACYQKSVILTCAPSLLTLDLV